MGDERTLKKCPFCAEDIMEAAIKCKHCGSMLDGSTQSQKVTVAGVDPFASYHTEIQGKKKGDITVIGYMGIALGGLLVLVSLMTLSKVRDGGESSFLMGFLGVGFIIASYLWARR